MCWPLFWAKLVLQKNATKLHNIFGCVPPEVVFIASVNVDGRRHEFSLKSPHRIKVLITTAIKLHSLSLLDLCIMRCQDTDETRKTFKNSLQRFRKERGLVVVFVSFSFCVA